VTLHRNELLQLKLYISPTCSGAIHPFRSRLASSADRISLTCVAPDVTFLLYGGDRFRRGYSEAKDARRGSSSALKSLKKTIANSELALAA
jgi:hypothetical protein